MNGRYTSSGMGLKIAGLVVVVTPVKPGVAGRDVQFAPGSEAEDVWMEMHTNDNRPTSQCSITT